ncbi:MAG: hypothetical protein ACI9V1_001828 [Spirosomataceae bacterium]|jgi:hypothetical protein
MWIASYTFSMPLEERDNFLNCYKAALLDFINDHEGVSEIQLLDILTVIDPTAASLSLQIQFKTEEEYADFSETAFPVVQKLLNIQLPNKYAYFHTLLKRI